jgi:DNA polymerase
MSRVDKASALQHELDASPAAKQCHVATCKPFVQGSIRFVPNLVSDINPPANARQKASARIAIVGEGPGRFEDRAGKPFSGPSGKVLDEALHEAGLSRDDVYITNLLKCRAVTVDETTGRLANRDPYPAEIAACDPLLHGELGIVKPSVIIAAGAMATRALTGVPSLADAMRREDLSYEGIPVIAMYHPSPRAHGAPGEAARMQASRVKALERAKKIARP